LPVIYGFREFAIAGGMMSYGPSLPAVYRRFATLVDKILKGETPAPIEFPRGSSWSSISRPLTSNSATVSALLKETRTIPIVLANMPDPVALGFAQTSPARRQCHRIREFWGGICHQMAWAAEGDCVLVLLGLLSLLFSCLPGFIRNDCLKRRVLLAYQL
jgi:hypothetical protein